jgi:hypothetical protein
LYCVKNLTTLRILTNVTNVTPDEVFCSRSRHVLTKFFSQKIISTFFEDFWPLLPLKVHFHDFCFVFGPFLRIPPTFSSILKVRTEGSFRLKLIVRFDNFVKYFIIFDFNSRVLTFGSKKVDCKLLFRSVCVLHEN